MQIADARTFAAPRGLPIHDADVFADDEVGGADLKRLRDRRRLLDRIRNGAYDVLLMRNSSRFSRRDADEAFAELKWIARQGVEIWFTDRRHLAGA